MIDFGSIRAVAGLPLAPQAHDGSIELKAGDWAVGYDLSVAWNANARARVGVTYRSEIEHTVKGTASFTVPAEAAALTAGGRAVQGHRRPGGPADAARAVGKRVYELGPKWLLVGM